MGQGPHYEPLEQVASGKATILTRALGDNQRPVILKQLRGEHPSRNELRRLQNEVAISHRLKGSGAALEVRGAEVVWGRLSLVLEDFAGRSLDQLLGQPMAPGRFLELAIALAGALAEVHRREVVHRDLKPGNVVVNEALGIVKIADFGIASLIPVERPAALSPGLIEGTPPYMSPEQTGRMNRAVDYRTDLYSLGVTFYEMLTGRLPFEERDTLGWFHAHLAKAPRDPGELVPDLPPPLAAIVLRLLAKAAEDRYQSALGLKLDLKRCLTLLEETGVIAPFALGAGDVPEHLQIPQRLYGREAELAALIQAFERVAHSGRPELVLVAGYSGIGKSSLVHELHKPVLRDRGYFLSGKFDQYRRDVPYSVITEAFHDLVQQILGESEETITGWRGRLTQALGINGRVLVDIVPGLEMVIGPQPPVSELPPTEAQNRLQLAFERFLGVCATAEHPLVLFLDDLQWADAASLALLEHLVVHPDPRSLLVIGAYRDNEVSGSHPLTLTLWGIEKAGASVRTIPLQPLSRVELGRFVADTLHCPAGYAEPLVRLLYEKTEGNPFFLNQFLRTLHDEGLITLDPVTAAWTWDIQRIEAQDFTANVVEMLVGRLARLPAATQDALRHAACLGNQFGLPTLATARAQPDRNVEAALRTALRERQLSLSQGTYRFVHDRVQQAAYALTPEHDRPGLHLRIGRRLLESSRSQEEDLFVIVTQLNRGLGLITDDAEKQALCSLNFRAGRKARASIAYVSACSYLTQALTLLPADAWDRQYQETLELHLELAECEYLVDRQRASELYEVILEKARSLSDRARAHRLRIRLFNASGRYEDSVCLVGQALRLFGLELPETASEAQAAFLAEHAQVAVNLRGRKVRDLVDAPLASDPDARALLGLLTEAQLSVYIARPHLYPLIAVRAVNQALQHGNTLDACPAYSGYGMALASVVGDYQGASEFSEMSLLLSDRLAGAKRKGRILLVHGAFISPWRQPLAATRPTLEQAFAACVEVGDLVDGAYALTHQLLHAVDGGDRLDDVLAKVETCAAFTQQHGLTIILELSRAIGQLARCLKRGETTFDDDAFSEARCLEMFANAGHGTGTVVFHIVKQIAAVHLGRWQEALEAAARAAPVLGAIACMPIEVTHHFCRAIALLALHDPGAPEQQQQLRDTLEPSLLELKRWAEACPENFLHQHALVAAEVARTEGRVLDAERLYEQALRSARDNGFVQNEALVSETASRFYRQRGLHTSAEAYLRNARAAYVRWGADGKVNQLGAQHPEVEEPEQPPAARTVTTRSERLDFLTAVKASQAISGQIVVDQLLETLMRVVLENAGAQRGGLVLPEASGLAVAAYASLERQAVSVRLRPPPPSTPLPWSIVNYVRRSRERVLLADATLPGPFAGDEYVVKERARSLLCLPVMRRAELIGILYLENDLVTNAFTADRITVLELLAAQVAISLENALLLAKEQAAREAAEAAERRAALIAHELRTPLATVKVRLGVLAASVQERDTVTTADLTPSLAVLARQCNRLDALIERLLESAGVQAGQLTLTREEVDLTAVVRDILDLLAEQGEGAGSELVVDAAGSVLGRWDRLRIEQVVTNLLTNAFKYGRGKPIRVAVDSDGVNARISVADHGIGIAPTDQPRLFEPFVRATDLHERRSLGIGLYLVREIVRAHGGRVLLSSEPGAGTTFVVELPLAPP